MGKTVQREPWPTPTSENKVLNAWSVLLLKKAMCGTCSTSELPIQFGIKLDGVTEVLRDALRLRTMVPRCVEPSSSHQPPPWRAWAVPVMKHSEKSLSSSGMIARSMTFSPRYLRPFDINAPRRAGRLMDRSL